MSMTREDDSFYILRKSIHFLLQQKNNCLNIESLYAISCTNSSENLYVLLSSFTCLFISTLYVPNIIEGTIKIKIRRESPVYGTRAYIKPVFITKVFDSGLNKMK